MEHDSNMLSPQEDEINLIEIFHILYKRKWLIISLTLITVLITVTVNYMMPKIYKVYTVIQPGVIDITKDGAYIYLDTVVNIKGKIENGAYDSRLSKALNISLSKAMHKINVSIPTNTNVLYLNSEFESNKIESGIKLIKQLFIELQTDYATDIQRKKDEYKKQILIKQNQIQSLEIQRKDMDNKISLKKNSIKEKRERIEIIKSSLKIYDQREKDLLQELKDVKENTEKIVQERDALLKKRSNDQNSGVSDLLYSTTIQQNMSFFNELKNQINDMKLDREQSKATISGLEENINELQIDIERMKLEKTDTLQSEIDKIKIEIDDMTNKINSIQNIKMISEPTVTPFPVKPRMAINVLLSLFGGLIISILIVFFIEYLLNSNIHKNKIHTK